MLPEGVPRRGGLSSGLCLVVLVSLEVLPPEAGAAIGFHWLGVTGVQKHACSPSGRVSICATTKSRRLRTPYGLSYLVISLPFPENLLTSLERHFKICFCSSFFVQAQDRCVLGVARGAADVPGARRGAFATESGDTFDYLTKKPVKVAGTQEELRARASGGRSHQGFPTPPTSLSPRD